MSEEVRRKTMKLIHDKYTTTLKWVDILPLIVQKRILKLRKTTKVMNVIFSDDEMYEVLVDNKNHHVVDLRRKKCDCGDCEVSSLPCAHVVCAIDSIRDKVEYYLH